jgi:hypothetical protein
MPLHSAMTTDRFGSADSCSGGLPSGAVAASFPQRGPVT